MSNTTKLIEGFQIEVTSAELKAHLLARAEKHEADADATGAEIRAALEKTPKSQRESLGMHEEVEAVRTDRCDAAECRFLAERLVSDAVYRLGPAELEYLRLVSTVTAWLGPRRSRRFRG